jgi:hypothetical protein
VAAFTAACGASATTGSATISFNGTEAGDRDIANTLHSANDARTAWDTTSMKVAA